MTLLNVATIVLILACLTVSFSGIEGFTQEHPQKPIRHSLLVRDLAASGQTEKALKAYYQFHKLGGTFSEELLLERLGALIVRGCNPLTIVISLALIHLLNRTSDAQLGENWGIKVLCPLDKRSQQ